MYVMWSPGRLSSFIQIVCGRGGPVTNRRGRIRDKDGYVLLRLPRHPSSNSGGYMREHRLVMERMLRRLLTREEVVHHINGIKDDNRPENLKLFASNSDHKRQDMRGNQWAKGDTGNPKRRHRVRRTPQQILLDLRSLASSLDRPIRRVDLQPPHPSYRAVAHAFGSWREGVAVALLEALDELEDAAKGAQAA